MTSDLLEKKAILALGGPVLLPEGFEIPFRVSRSTAGPGAGFYSIAMGFDRFRVKKSVSYETGEFELHDEGGRLSLTHRGQPFLDDISLMPVVRHCPEQAFFDLDPRCMFHCAYCSSPVICGDEDKHLDSERIMEMLRESVSSHDVKAVSFTSGVYGSIGETVERLADVIGRVRSEYPDMPIGVEPYVSSEEHIRKLKDAGADEIKLNLQCADRVIFSKVCPDLDYDGILSNLESAVRIFGRGRVTSNVIYGLGESDEDVRRVTELLCSMGVIPGLRALRINKYNRSNLETAIGQPVPVTPERSLAVAKMQKEVMEKHGLTSVTSHTMCLECGCCDLVPFRDL